MATDGEIERAVRDELRRDAHVGGADIHVRVEGGVVILSGAVCSHAKKVAAAEAAHRARPGLDVANEIAVRVPRGAGRTDTELARRVRDALARAGCLPAPRIETTVCHGWVTLAGSVDRWTQRAAAERIARCVPGVAEVVSRIAIAR